MLSVHSTNLELKIDAAKNKDLKNSIFSEFGSTKKCLRRWHTNMYIKQLKKELKPIEVQISKPETNDRIIY